LHWTIGSIKTLKVQSLTLSWSACLRLLRFHWSPRMNRTTTTCVCWTYIRPDTKDHKNEVLWLPEEWCEIAKRPHHNATT
jgi:hypothetical protein